jgi:hypothetical protein
MNLPLIKTTSVALTVASLTLISFVGRSASGQTLPINYQLQLQMRANIGGTAFNLPNGSTVNSVSPSLNDSGNVAVKINTVGFTVNAGLFFGGHGAGGIVYNANDTEALLSDPYINANNRVSFPRFASSSATDDGIYIYDRASGMTTRATNGPLGATSYTNPQLNDNNIIGMRAKFSTPQALLNYNVSSNIFTTYVVETGGDPNSRYSFIYAPAFNNNARIAAQANITGQASTYKELRIWNPDGTSTLVASGDSSIGPVFYAFDNSITMNNHEQVAFTTRTSPSATTRRIVVSDGTTTTLFPTVSAGAGFTSIDSFPPSINDNGVVAFRGNDNQATPRDSVFVTDGVTFQRIVGVNDTLMTDEGPRVIGSLMGSVDLNNRGAVAFGVQFTGASGGGEAIYVAYVRIVPVSAVSRKTHGAAGVFDVNLPLTGTPGIECRQGSGPSLNSHQIVVTFAAPVTLASASVTSGSGIVDSAVATGNQITVNLSNVANAQTLMITLLNVNDGANSSDVVMPISFLLGDVNGNGSSNATDVAQTKAQAGTPTAGTFRADVNATGTINATDISLVKSTAGTSLP